MSHINVHNLLLNILIGQFKYQITKFIPKKWLVVQARQVGSVLVLIIALRFIKYDH